MAANWFIAFPMQVERLWLHSDPPPGVRRFVEDDLHCTLAFLGRVGESMALRAWSRATELLDAPAVHGTFANVEPLGNPRKPSALSAIVGEGRVPFCAMIDHARGSILDAAGAPPDDRPPLPHMTIARIQRRASSAERRKALEWAASLDVGAASFIASSVALYAWAEDRRERLFRIVSCHALARAPV